VLYLALLLTRLPTAIIFRSLETVKGLLQQLTSDPCGRIQQSILFCLHEKMTWCSRIKRKAVSTFDGFGTLFLLKLSKNVTK